jgi:hypothetical protein
VHVSARLLPGQWGGTYVTAKALEHDPHRHHRQDRQVVVAVVVGVR